MDVAISSEVLARIVAEAAASPEVEVCGLLLGRIEPIEALPFVLSLSKDGLPMGLAGEVLRQAQHERRGGRYRIDEALPCRNVAVDPARTFEIDPASLLAAHRQARAGGAAILGCYHSHPSGRAEPSARDAEDAAANGWVWVIVAGDEVRGWRAVPEGAVWGRFEGVGLRPRHCRRSGHRKETGLKL